MQLKWYLGGPDEYHPQLTRSNHFRLFFVVYDGKTKVMEFGGFRITRDFGQLLVPSYTGRDGGIYPQAVINTELQIEVLKDLKKRYEGTTFLPPRTTHGKK